MKGIEMQRTKIVCTIGPASDQEEVLQGMILAGMDVARINFSHGDQAAHARRIALVRRLAEEEGQIVALMGDLQGPKLRIGPIASGEIFLQPGSELTLTARPLPGDEHQVHLPHPQVFAAVRPGDRLLLDDGLIELAVLAATPTDLRCQVVVGGTLGSHKGLTVPGVALDLPSLTDKDREDAAFAAEQKLDWLALSFVRCAAGVEELRSLLGQRGADTPIVAKIEKREALEAFDEILEASDGIMVARGDLGVETPAEEVPIHQKVIIRKSREHGKPVITATQMLSSMTESPRPTRAEASDVANAILDGTDAVMLSGETAVGRYPIRTTETMARIAAIAERSLPYEEWARHAMLKPPLTPTDAISRATCEIALDLDARAIITSTTSGYTARMVAKHRPATHILAVTPNPAVCQRLAMVWGVCPAVVPEFATTDEMIVRSVAAAQEMGLVTQGDTVIITAGVPFGGPGRTNVLKVHVVE